jgi:membrane-bound lytic murein transglycosylase B
MRELFGFIREAKASTEVEKQELDQKKNAEADAKYVVETRKKTIAESEAEQKKLLAITKQEEKTYADVLAERQARAAQIRAALFRLRDTEGISFGQALEYANIASKSTGVRPALLLAILTQESDLGKNLGSCLVTDLVTGNGVGKNTGTPFEQIMKAPRDTVPFTDIMKRLGRDSKLTPVSCPPGHTYYVGRGFGGGMGPSQFIPSTWELFKDRIGGAMGVSPNQADPWNPEHAFTATAIYMSDLGASAGGYSAERNAACRYYSGAVCTPGRVPSNVFYGDQVMQKAQSIQENIDFLKGV